MVNAIRILVVPRGLFALEIRPIRFMVYLLARVYGAGKQSRAFYTWLFTQTYIKTMKIRIAIALVIIFFTTLPFSAWGEAGKNKQWDCLSTTWPHEQSDLKPDPALHFGKLKNGLRYVLMKNQEPKNRVAIYLNVQAGSLHETDEQQGLAHFLEHMLFNGTTHFPAGKLVEYFQSIGMSFGGDTNAHTTYDETVYHILLPGNSDEEIDKGLLVMSDYARGALLPESEVERERGVILSEKRSRDSASYRTHVATTKFTMKGTRLPHRMPIGTEKTIKEANRKRLLDYYNNWYRPENSVLVMVGDFEPDRVKPLLEKQFGHLTAGASPPLCPDLGRIDHKGTDYFYHHEPEEGHTEISIERVWNEPRQNDSFALQQENLRRYGVALIMRHRVQKLIESGNSPFSSGSYYGGIYMGTIGYGSIHVKSSPENWSRSMSVLEQTLRQALLYGFSDDEASRVKKELGAKFESAVLTANTRSSKQLANSIIYHINKNRVFQSPKQEKKLYLPVIQAMSAADLHETLKKTWSGDKRLISVTGNAVIKSDNQNQLKTIKALYSKSLQQQVSKPVYSKSLSFPYLNLIANKVEPAKVNRFQEIETRKIVLPNGVIVNLKRTDFKKNSISLVADVGNGKVSEPVAGMRLLAESVINGSGTGKMKKSEIKSALAASTANLHFKVRQTSFQWMGKSVTKDSEQLFQLLCTYLLDPGLRQDVYTVAKQKVEQIYLGLQRDINGATQLKVDRFFGDNHRFFGLDPWDKISNVTLEQIGNWLLPQFKHGSLEISIVGDFDPEKMKRLAVKYFGNLPERKQFGKNKNKIEFPSGQLLTTEVDTKIDKALLVIGWPTDDFWDINRTRRLHTLASVFRDRLRKVIREKLGATYSPVVYNHSSRVFDGYGALKVMLVVEPEKVEQLKKEVFKLADELRTGGVSEEELKRAKAPSLTSIKDMKRTNSYWLNSVLSLSSRHPEQFDWPTTILAEFAAITKEELTEMARKYLDNSKSATAIVTPKR